MGLFNNIIRSWQFLVQCFRFFGHNKDLLFFPIISIISTFLLIFILFAGGALEINTVSYFIKNHPGVSLVAFIALYFFFSFIIIYFNASLIACATLRLKGEAASVGDGLGLAANHWWPLLQWTIISTTIGLIIRSIENSHSVIEDIIALILGFAWTISTYFVIPIMVFENTGPFTSIKKGFSLFGRGWRRVLSVFLIFNLFFAAIFGVLYGLQHLMPNNTLAFIEIGGILLLIFIILSATIGSAFNGIINSALYLSFVEKKDPAGFDPQLLKQAFAQKKKFGRSGI